VAGGKVCLFKWLIGNTCSGTQMHMWKTSPTFTLRVPVVTDQFLAGIRI
jgi:hypothetical protein